MEPEILVLGDEMSTIKVMEGMQDKGVYIWLKTLTPTSTTGFTPHFANIELSNKDAEDLYAWLDLYLHEDKHDT